MSHLLVVLMTFFILLIAALFGGMVAWYCMTHGLIPKGHSERTEGEEDAPAHHTPLDPMREKPAETIARLRDARDRERGKLHALRAHCAELESELRALKGVNAGT